MLSSQHNSRIVFFPTIHTPSRQSWRGNRIAPVSPRKHWERSAVQRCASRLAARIARKKLCQRGGTQRLADILAARFPASNLGSKNKGVGKIKLFPTRERIETHPKLEFHVRHASIANVLDIMRK